MGSIVDLLSVQQSRTRGCDDLLVGESAAMREVRSLIQTVAKRQSTVLVSGETGTGKDLAARSIHMSSDRANREMVSMNCAALPQTLLDEELFGHVKGAYTGAASHRAGRFEQAQNSTIFLDEIGEMPLDTQAKLLRVLQERELQRLGSSETIKVNVRVIAASNLDLARAAKLRQFRADLLYRLRVVEIRMPSLRERIEDIPCLVEHFLEKICKREQMPSKRFEPAAMRFLSEHSWPGNVRELEHTIESAVVLTGDRRQLNSRDLKIHFEENELGAGHMDLPPNGIELERLVAGIEATLLGQALRRSLGNKARAAAMLGIPRTTLISKVKSLQLVG